MKRTFMAICSTALCVLLCLPAGIQTHAAANPVVIDVPEKPLYSGDEIQITVRACDDQIEGITGSIMMRNLHVRRVDSTMGTESAFVLLPCMGLKSITYTCVVEGEPGKDVAFVCRGISRSVAASSICLPDVSWEAEVSANAASETGISHPPVSILGAVSTPSASANTEKPEIQETKCLVPLHGASIRDGIFLYIPAWERGESSAVASLNTWLDIRDDLYMCVYTRSRESAPPLEPLATGQMVEVRDRENRIVVRLTLIVSGDVLGTGRRGIQQIVRMAQGVCGKKPLDDTFRLAADLTGNGVVDIADLTECARMLT